MPIPVPHRRRWWARARSVVAVLLAATGGSYAVFGSELLVRVGAVFDRAGRRVEETTADLRTRSEVERLNQSRKTYEELLACREALARQVKSLGEHRAAVAARHAQSVSLLQRVVAARGEKEIPAGELTRAVVEQDAVDVLRRVQADEDELAKCDADLGRLVEGLDRLDRNVGRARLALQQQSDELERRKAGAAGGRAYRDGLDLADRIVPSRR